MLRVWNPAHGDRALVDLREAGAWGITGIAWSPDGRSLAIATADGTWLLPRLREPTSLHRLQAPGSVVAWG